MSDVLPCLTISYSSDFSLSIQLQSVQIYEVASTDYCFDFTCRVRHATGEFTYEACDIYFPPQMFRDFADQLHAIRKGEAQHAKLRDYGQMIEFSIYAHDRKTQAYLRITEYQPGAEQTLLSAAFPVDYDLFVNSLYQKTVQFLSELSPA